ncbi:putative damage-inducible protein DinB [Saccharothrix coeruleofusca]|uniref:DinB family protein n=1 Tax=Saccharothrix coeruleofusca TaxID=33919 RepID=UPI001AEA7AFF|nr:DinB family protein [Saccharothrix coeruleofusca]MBP2335172.1 putative damage-inducible protein DinB [Saccharothrix coeruleofusca]
MTTVITTGERAELLQALTQHRGFLRFTAQGLTDEQATTRTTVSELTVAGLIKHVTQVEEKWIDFVLDGPAAMNQDYEEHANGFRMLPGETLQGLLDRYEEVARRTDELVATHDLDARQPLPEAPWFEPGAQWSFRRVLVHLVAETSQHAGHADIIREGIDGQKSMG